LGVWDSNQKLCFYTFGAGNIETLKDCVEGNYLPTEKNETVADKGVYNYKLNAFVGYDVIVNLLVPSDLQGKVDLKMSC